MKFRRNFFCLSRPRSLAQRMETTKFETIIHEEEYSETPLLIPRIPFTFLRISMNVCLSRQFSINSTKSGTLVSDGRMREKGNWQTTDNCVIATLSNTNWNMSPTSCSFDVLMIVVGRASYFVVTLNFKRQTNRKQQRKKDCRDKINAFDAEWKRGRKMLRQKF